MTIEELPQLSGLLNAPLVGITDTNAVPSIWMVLMVDTPLKPAAQLVSGAKQNKAAQQIERFIGSLLLI